MNRHLALLILAACSSNEDQYCENIGDCAQGGSFMWIQACQANVGAARDEAERTSCKPAFDAYYACASSRYACKGNTPTFPNCEQPWQALNACIANAQSQPDSGATFCAQLSALQAAGGCVSPDAGIQQACNAGRDCEAQCFVTSVGNVCAPDLNGLDAYTQCASSCPTH
jgi:hypothetical protein